jgi:hypothetical protein
MSSQVASRRRSAMRLSRGQGSGAGFWPAIVRPAARTLAISTFAAFLCSSASAETIGSVILEDYKGAVATPDGGTDPREIRYQDQVMALDTVETGDEGATSMRFLDETRFDVGPNAMVTLDDFVFDPASAIGAGKISMAVGAFRYIGGNMKSEENVKLVTPTSTMTIRGTQLVIFVGLDGTTEINVVEGAVEVQPCDKPVAAMATAGQRVIVPLTCKAVVTTSRPVEDLALDVPADLADFSTAAGGDDSGDDGGDEGGGDTGGPGDKEGKETDDSSPDPEPEPPAPEPEPEPEPNEGGEENPNEGGGGNDGGDGGDIGTFN